MDYYHGRTSIFSNPDLKFRKNRQISLGIGFIVGTEKEEIYE